MSGFSQLRPKASLRDKAQNSGSSSALAAVALQDHIMKNLQLSMTFGPKRIPPGKPRPKKEVKAVVDTGRAVKPGPKKKQEDEEKEFVLDRKPPPPTLAQKLGLVDAPEQLLTETEWNEVKQKSSKRDDFRQPCVICKEDLGSQQQVLLSCSHVFHRACLQAFERYTGRKTCPMCRREQYQTRVVHDGTRHYKEKCATTIQAAWRGYVVRKWYLNLRETVPPNDPNLRRKFYEDKLHNITDRIVRSCDFDINNFFAELDRNLEASREVFQNFETAVRPIDDEEWDRIQQRAVERGNKECPICLTSLWETDMKSPRNESNSLQAKAKETVAKIANKQSHLTSGSVNQRSRSGGSPGKESRSYMGVHKDTLLQKSASAPQPGRGKLSKKTTSHVSSTTDKSMTGDVTLSNVEKSKDNSIATSKSEQSTTKRKQVKETVLLSCSHVFHKNCVEAFEELAVGEKRHSCPVCRASYQKKILTSENLSLKMHL
ncbi:RING finger protein 32-like isoform X2 [Lingula anatina]|uniref:RING finger protein 32-like isoform X2 n=1 Tax=Lingula anatina TaxID=7574 RepID=A0A1S3J1A6_LINAN|nr:RING finger protein 32-like isoform X2 [Lingula anatina]|eukprot:XP_013404225.1 RING finger protein 32-like isoform X2 [Lingula anatina]